MSTRSTKPVHAKAPAAHAPSADSWAQLGVKQTAWALDNTRTLIKGMEAMRKVQFEAAQRTHKQLQAACERLRHFDTATEALSLQAELAQEDSAAALRYWRDLFEIGMKTQQEMMKSMASAFSQQGSDVLGAAVEAARTPSADVNSAFDEWMRKFFSPIAAASSTH